MIFKRVFLAVLLAAAVGGSSSAAAESRLFSVRTDQPGVTASAASQNGRSLAIAGRSGGLTFFRIESAGPVPCVNTLTFGLSDGSSLGQTIDFCSQNWDVTLVLSGPAAPAFGTIRIVTDDPGAEIVEVFSGGRPVPIIGRSGPSVDVALGGEQGCQRDLGLELGDGRRLARMVDICAEQGFVRFQVIGGGSTAEFVAQPPASLPPIVQPQPLPGPAPVTAAMSWFTGRNGDQASLRYAQPTGGAGEFTAVCQMGSGSATIILTRTSPEVVPGSAVGVRFDAGGFGAVYTAAGSAVSQLSGRSHPQISLPASDPLWGALIRENTVTIGVASSPRFGLSLKGSAAKVQEFQALCSPSLPTPPPPPPRQTAGTVAFVCNDGSSISVLFDGANDTATVFDGAAQPIVLRRSTSQNGARFVAPNAELVGLDEQITWRGPSGFVRICTAN